MPWVRKIHLVTAGQIPDWLDTSHEKIHLVNHKDIFPNTSDLPTFNACAIEMCLGAISDLAEKFIFFNDDMFVVQPIRLDRFFKNGYPKDFFTLDILLHAGIFSHILHSDMQIVNNEFKNKKKYLKENFFKVFNYKYGIKRLLKNFLLLPFPSLPMFEIYHHPQALLKKYVKEVMDRYPEEVKQTRSHHFKNATDLNQYVFRYMHLIRGEFIPYIPKDSLYIGVNSLDNLKKSIEHLRVSQSIKFVCFNEESGFDTNDYGEYKEQIRDYLESVLPDKSTFER